MNPEKLHAIPSAEAHATIPRVPIRCVTGLVGTLFAAVLVCSGTLHGQAQAQPDVNSPDVRDTKVYDMGDHRVIVQEVTEATLPVQPPPPPPAAKPEPKPLSPEIIAERKARAAKQRHINFGGTVYQTADGTRRSLITCRPADGGDPVVFWSSVDWDLLRVGRFVSPEGLEYLMMVMVSPVDIARTQTAWAKHGRTWQAPQVPAFSGTAASFRIVSGQPSAATLADIAAVHAYHDREHAALLDAQRQRDEARRIAEEEAKKPQPPPPDVIIQGRPMTPEELEGVAAGKPATNP